ncbi:DUF599 domain-containing protein [Pseudooceanicola sediminis]|uniref:DUF599 domain-containing protein n=1 Tax=Pseudooceanicola sediminis TaxID=2211117 RepID=A0A399J486_9RHOB|nr:DUF599 domain-containing protein [Pseudooceanicola sediminis]KAA2315646.1 DUF599 domain-containing protein [Puniceibacterium sp. HSS470]RII40155.1 DUF599 domain-containing protein [Pseudooceanicola sediminis]|tara:strand:+ start:84649 stop:85362 length:714 start_codon:yes stop_codon:yes gene_type:complete
MTSLDFLTLFTVYDVLAVAAILLAWLTIGWRIEHPSKRRPSVSILMAGYRREWMRQMVTRQPRIFDSHILSTLRQGTSFFGSATMIAIGGVLALIGNSEPLGGIAEQLGADDTPLVFWEMKLVLVLFFLTNAFLKFVWSHRLFGYCAVMMGSVPNEIDDSRAVTRALKAAEVNISAARGFNRGLRSVYFAMAATAWALGPMGLLIATIVTCSILWRREFASLSRAVLLSGNDRETGM